MVLMHDCGTEYFRSLGGTRGERHPEARLCRGRQRDGEEPRRDLRSFQFFIVSAASIGPDVQMDGRELERGRTRAASFQGHHSGPEVAC